MSKINFSKEAVKKVILDIDNKVKILNINKFSNQVDIEIEVSNFTHKAKSDLEKKLLPTLNDFFLKDISFSIKFTPVKKDDLNKVNQLSNIKNGSSNKKNTISCCSFYINCNFNRFFN